MQRFPLFDGDVEKWIRETINTQARNVTQRERDLAYAFHRLGPPVSLVWAATVEIDIRLDPRNHYRCTSVNANGTINASNVGNSGRIVTFRLTNDGTSNRTVTFGTGFKDDGDLVGTTSQTATATFVEDGGYLWEIGRVTGIA